MNQLTKAMHDLALALREIASSQRELAASNRDLAESNRLTAQMLTPPGGLLPPKAEQVQVQHLNAPGVTPAGFSVPVETCWEGMSQQDRETYTGSLTEQGAVEVGGQWRPVYLPAIGEAQGSGQQGCCGGGCQPATADDVQALDEDERPALPHPDGPEADTAPTIGSPARRAP